MTEIAHLKEGINIKKAEIQANTTKIAQEKEELTKTKTKVETLKLVGEDIKINETVKQTSRVVDKMNWEM